MQQERGGEQHAVEITDNVERETRETSKAILEWLKEKLEVEDKLWEEGMALLANRDGIVRGPTIFKRKRKADGSWEPPKPRAVAIGPYHRESLSSFNDDYKWKVTRFMASKWSLDVKKYLEKMEECEEDACGHYSEDLSKWNSEVFRTMLLLDSCFILFAIDAFNKFLLQSNFLFEHMALYAEINKHPKEIKLDFLMPDNQIPFFAIELLLDCLHENHKVFEGHSIEDLALSCFDELWPTRNNEREKDGDAQFNHLLHLFHWSRIPTKGYKIDSEERSSRNASQQYIPSATELRKSATKFKKKKGSGSCLDITFNCGLTCVSGVINIPTLHLYDYSEEIFRNLIAFERNPTNSVLCFTAYSACMSCILQREDDVKLLREKGVVASTNFRDADVVSFFAKLNKETEDSLLPKTLLELYSNVTGHHNRRISNIYANFKLQYCPNMWVGLSLVAASMLFVLALLQTIFTITSK